MKNILQIGLFTLLSFSIFAQSPLLAGAKIGFENDSTMRAQLLDAIKSEHNARSEEYNKQLQELNHRIQELDKQVQSEKDAQAKVKSLIERVQVLEKKEEAGNNNIEGVYQQNYQTAVVNLFFMERELKPLALFNSSKDFFGALSDVSNPMNYKGYQEWFGKFKQYIEANKNKVPTLEIIGNLLTLAGGTSKNIPLAGPVSHSLFEGIGLFISSLSNKKDENLRKESVQMFQLTATLSQFIHERDLIEHEWQKLNKELDELQKLQRNCLDENFKILGISAADFQQNFTTQTDANKYFEYIKNIASGIHGIIKQERAANPEKWKTKFYYQMQSVQALKIRFGTLTFRIKENIAQYKELIDKYSKSETAEMKENMRNLSLKLDQLNNAFDKQFSPQEYIRAATQMYMVD